jgi:pSer/pThr/pTyr-binding forkhead associated (FHA) protein
MPITVIVRTAAGGESRLTFDGTQRIVLGRGAGCDVRLPDPSVSVRHASLRAQGAEFALVDEGSTNGTFVGDVRIAARTSRIIRSGQHARLGRVWLEVRLDQGPVTRDLAAATREVALALVAEALDAAGMDPTLHVAVVEGRDQGARLALLEENRAYLVGRGAECDLPLADPDASREHLHVVQRAGVVFVRDLGTKNGAWLGDARVPSDREAAWKPALMVRVGRSVLALREPVGEALGRIEAAPDEPLPPGAEIAPPVGAPAPPVPSPPPAGVEGADVFEPPDVAPPRSRRRTGWSPVDIFVMAAAIGVLALSIAGLVWLLRS